MADIIISESQLRVIREFENGEVLFGEFSSKTRGYISELMRNSLHPRLDGFFTDHGIGEKELLGKMLDLGIISRKDKVGETEGADGKRHSVYGRTYTVHNSRFNDKMRELYDSFFSDGRRKEGLSECDCGSAMGGGATACGNLMAGTSDASGGITYPFALMPKRRIGRKSSKDGNIDMGPSSERKPGKVAVNTKK